MVMKSRSWNDAEYEYGGPQHRNLFIMTEYDALLYAKIFVFLFIVQQLRSGWQMNVDRGSLEHHVPRLFNALIFLELLKS